MRVAFYRQRMLTVLGLTLVLFALGSAAIKVGVWRHFVAASNNTQQQLLPGRRGLAQVVRFTVYDAGIFPAEASASPGVVALHIEDMSGNSSGLLVQTETGIVLAQVSPRERTWRGSARLLLASGRYQIIDANRRSNRATLIVGP
jgi:hypothetical protein